MANRVLFIGWNRPAVGREQEAMRLWPKVMEYYGKLKADGQIESFEPVFLNAHGGDLNGFILLRGDAEKLSKIRRDDTFIDHTIEAEYCLEGFGIVGGYIGDGLADLFKRWAKFVTS